LREPIRTDAARLALSAEEEARVGEILAALPEEAARVHAAVTRLLFDVIGVFHRRLVTPSDLDETLTWLADTFLSLTSEDDVFADPGGILALFTRHAMIQARGAILDQLVWARRN
jgi:hypothetical protein